MSQQYQEAPRGRLQRPPDFTGARLNSFRSVFIRHGLPGAVLTLLTLLGMGMLTRAQTGFTPLVTQPLESLLTIACILLPLVAYATYLDRGWRAQNLLWIVYLGLLSCWEEWAFRVALPIYFEGMALSPLAAGILSNLLFGVSHYFTLRWRWQWCLGAFLGGLALSRHFNTHASLLTIIALHWIGTSLNTPRPP